MRRWLVVSGLLICVLVLLLFPRGVDRDWQRTIESFQQLDPFPLYQMTYYGDYGFGEYLEQGGGNVSVSTSVQDASDRDWVCTCFAALNPAGEPVFGRNFDWHVHPALVLFTDPPDGYASVSMVDVSYLGYGSEYPNQEELEELSRAPFLPFDGMNQHGLAVGMMAVPQADSGTKPARMTLDSLEIIRLMLDYARDVEQAIAMFEQYNIDFGGGPPLHYLLADRSGNSALLELVDGELKVIRSEQPWQAATNFIFTRAAPQADDSPCWRYNTAYAQLQTQAGEMNTQQALDLLEKVSQGGDHPTIWSVVYELESAQMSVVVDRKYQQVYEFSVAGE
jgi:hypothetical protein